MQMRSEQLLKAEPTAAGWDLGMPCLNSSHALLLLKLPAAAVSAHA